MSTKRIEFFDFVLNTITPEEADKLWDAIQQDDRFSDCFPIKPPTLALKNTIGKDCCDWLIETALQLKRLYPEGNRKMTAQDQEIFFNRTAAIRRFLFVMEEDIRQINFEESKR